MNSLLRPLAAVLAAVLAFCVPLEASAQAVSAAARASASGSASAAAVTARPFAASALNALPLLPAAAVPSLTGVAAPAPALGPAANDGAAVARFDAAAAARPAFAPVAGRPVASLPEAAAIGGLTRGAEALQRAGNDGASAQAALDLVFEGGAVRRASALEVPASAAASPAPEKGRLSPARGPRWVKNLRPDAPAPRTDYKRTLAVGTLTGVLTSVLTHAAIVAAGALGWQFDSNYSIPDIAPAALFFAAVVLAPITEEAVFRGGLQGWLTRLFANSGRFLATWLPTLATAAIFVSVHETSDPVLMAVRMAGAVVFSRVYAKEGILASITMHAVYNFMAFLPLLFTAMTLPAWAALPATLAALAAAWKSSRYLKSQKAEKDSGALVPKPLSSALALRLALASLAGFLFIMPNPMWLLGAIAFFIAWQNKKKA